MKNMLSLTSVRRLYQLNVQMKKKCFLMPIPTMCKEMKRLSC